MKLVSLDFETYYDSTYSLTRMSTEDYINDPRFEVIMVGAHFAGEQPTWKTGTKKEIAQWLEEIGVWDSFAVAHNGMFDFLICAVHFGRLPKRMGCTRMMAYATLRPYMRTVSLAACLEELDLNVRKGTEVENMRGRTRTSLSKAEMARYASYCMNDCTGTLELFKKLAPMFPKEEFSIIDMTLRMYVEPVFELDATVLAEHLAAVKAKKAQLLNMLPPSITKADLMSNPKFAKILESLGVEPPRKVSLTTGEETFAFAKNDTGWKQLEEEYADDPLISSVLAARLGAKSTLEETRTTRLLDIATRYDRFRIPLMYYAAHTGRYGGTEGINAQNFPRVDKSRMRFGIKAPQGFVVLAADLAQIEARITAWLACCTPLLEGFRRNEDLYSKFASRVFREEVVKDRSPLDKFRRFVGKTCILGLGFGMASVKLQATLYKDGLRFSTAHTSAMVDLYRSDYWQIPDLWRTLDSYLHVIADGGRGQVQVGPVTLGHRVVVLPNGMMLHYPRLCLRENKKQDPARRQRMQWMYRYGVELRTVWGGKLTENIVQALARIIVMQHMIEIRRQLGLRPALQQHDELDYVVREEDAAMYAGEISRIMSVPPSWAPDLPVAVEVNYGPTLGDCK